MHAPTEQLYLIDGIGPFFRNSSRKEINWSKIDFSELEKDGIIPLERCRTIATEFRTFTRRAASMGYNAVSLDDLAHVVLLPEYPEALRRKIDCYRTLFRELFQIAAESGMQVFITTDLLFFNPTIEQITGNKPRRIREFTADCCRKFFGDFPEVAGLILRIGESDGVDVDGDFHSRLIIETPVQARKMLDSLLPVFESYGRLLIFRTWTVGISRIGDLIWNRETFNKTFGKIDSPSLVISMKYGESDFFRFLPLNRLFFESRHRKLIELQTRREYEGFGEFPSFTGRDYEHLRKQLFSAYNIVGITVWCQTGGWSGFRRLSLLDESAIWTDINTYTTIRIFRDDFTVEQALQAYCREHLKGVLWPHLRDLLDLSDRVTKNLLYIDEFATRRIFFRRLRLPPLITVFWKHIIVSHLLRKILRCYVSKTCGMDLVRSGAESLRDIRQMQRIAKELGLPSDDFDFQYDTFRLIAAARAYFFLPQPERVLAQLQKLKVRYEAKWPEPRYTVQIDDTPCPLPRTHLHRLFRMLFRHRHGYRWVDRLLTLTVFSALQPLIRRLNHRIFPDFAKDQAMGINSVFK